MLLVIFSVLIYPVANFSFILRAIKRLYFAKTKDRKIFEVFKQKHDRVFSEFYDKYSQESQLKQNKKLKIIDFSNYDSFCLFYAIKLGKFFCCKK